MSGITVKELTGKELLLRDLNYQIPTDERDELIKRINKGRYAECRSRSINPSTDLRMILEKLHYDDMAEKALCGLYDHEL